MAIEIVDLPMKHGGSFHSFLYVYQRVKTWLLRFLQGQCQRSAMDKRRPRLQVPAMHQGVGLRARSQENIRS